MSRLPGSVNSSLPSRRMVLRGLGVTLVLPWLDITRPVSALAVPDLPAAGGGGPRLACIYLPNGIVRGTWRPAETGAGGRLLALNPWMRPLEPFREHLLVARNLRLRNGNGHAAAAGWLAVSDERAAAGRASMDQIAARHLGGATPLPSIALTTRTARSTADTPAGAGISRSASGRAVACEAAPQAVFNRMFQPSPRAAHGDSVLDAVLQDARAVRRMGSAADRLRIDDYFESIRDVEKRIAYADGLARAMCGDSALTDTGLPAEPGIPPVHRTHVRLLLDLIVLAFWSGASRVATFMLDHEQSDRDFGFRPGVDGTWHALSHYRDASGRMPHGDRVTAERSPKPRWKMYSRVVRWHHSQVAYLLGRLRAIVEPDGRRLLDKSAIVYGAGMADGNDHDANDLPLLVAGGGDGALRSGRAIEFAKPTELGDFHAALLQRMGAAPDLPGRGAASRQPLYA